jgi:catalase
VVVLASAEGSAALARMPAARDFVTDAYAHCKFIAYVSDATALFDATGLSSLMDDGFVELSGGDAVAGFLDTCRQLRFWDRQLVSA